MYFPVIPQGRIQEGENAKRQKKNTQNAFIAVLKILCLVKYKRNV